MTWVKICGVRTLEEARAVQHAGAAAYGQVFAQSPRRISPDDAARINRSIKGGILKVGVFVDEGLETVKRIARECRLDIIQLHGSEPREYLAELNYPVIKAFSVQRPIDADDLDGWNAWAFLLDAYSPERRGGTGKAIAPDLLKSLGNFDNIILAGGLRPDNVGEAIRRYRPMGVDVSSGVEYPHGGKNPHAILRFMQEVREASGIQPGPGRVAGKR
jgi:phosphoribosylanthranilate isomerase